MEGVVQLTVETIWILSSFLRFDCLLNIIIFFLQKIVSEITSNYNREQLWFANEDLIIQLQAKAKGFLVRKKYKERKAYLQAQEPSVIKIQVVCVQYWMDNNIMKSINKYSTCVPSLCFPTLQHVSTDKVFFVNVQLMATIKVLFLIITLGILSCEDKIVLPGISNNHLQSLNLSCQKEILTVFAM